MSGFPNMEKKSEFSLDAGLVQSFAFSRDMLPNNSGLALTDNPFMLRPRNFTVESRDPKQDTLYALGYVVLDLGHVIMDVLHIVLDFTQQQAVIGVNGGCVLITIEPAMLFHRIGHLHGDPVPRDAQSRYEI